MQNTSAESNLLRGIRIAVLISDGFEQSEFDGPVAELKKAGAEVDVLAQYPNQLEAGIRGFHHMEPGRVVQPEKLITAVSPDEYGGLLIPGGGISVDLMRLSLPHLTFVRNFVDSGKPVAAICHAGWLLADAGVARGRTMTSWPAIRKDLERAGAIWKDREVVEDENLVTSRKPTDVPAFTKAFIALLSKFAQRKIEAA